MHCARLYAVFLQLLCCLQMLAVWILLCSSDAISPLQPRAARTAAGCASFRVRAVGLSAPLSARSGLSALSVTLKSVLRILKRPFCAFLPFLRASTLSKSLSVPFCDICEFSVNSFCDILLSALTGYIMPTGRYIFFLY